MNNEILKKKKEISDNEALATIATVGAIFGVIFGSWAVKTALEFDKKGQHGDAGFFMFMAGLVGHSTFQFVNHAIESVCQINKTRRELKDLSSH